MSLLLPAAKPTIARTGLDGAELIGTALLVAALTGFSIRRSQPSLVGVAVATTILIVAVTMVVEASTWA